MAEISNVVLIKKLAEAMIMPLPLKKRRAVEK